MQRLLHGYGPDERAAWQAAFQEDVAAAAAQGRVHAINSPPGPAVRAHEIEWDRKRAVARATVEALEWALGRRETLGPL